MVGGAATFYAWRVRSSFGSTRSTTIDGQENLTRQLCLEATASVMAAARYGFCCISSTDGSAPTCRIMDLHTSRDGSFKCWFITRDWTRKASLLSTTPQCSLAFHDPRAAGENGYAVLYGSIRPLTDASEREAHWKPSWSFFHQGGPRGPSLVWEFVPERIEVISHAHAVAPAWQPATLVRDAKAGWVLQPLKGRSR